MTFKGTKQKHGIFKFVEGLMVPRRIVLQIIFRKWPLTFAQVPKTTEMRPAKDKNLVPYLFVPLPSTWNAVLQPVAGNEPKKPTEIFLILAALLISRPMDNTKSFESNCVLFHLAPFNQHEVGSSFSTRNSTNSRESLKTAPTTES